MDKIILTTPVVHNPPICQTSGANACKDFIHLKTCWSKDDLDLMGRILQNYINVVENQTQASGHKIQPASS